MNYLQKRGYLLLSSLSILLTSAIYSCSDSSSVEEQLAEVPETIDYNFHVRPILSDRCFVCHGPDANKREAGLRLDTEEGAYAALKENPGAHAIVAGSVDKSELFQRIISTDSTELMPPPESNLALKGFEIEILKKWIEQGAKYKPHWAFISPEKSELPDADKDFVTNEIDYFTFAKMRGKGMKPNEEADKETLLKRVSFDLTGLPPSLELQDKFLKDNSPDAYEKVIDELLASKHYGEKMATSWLDVARYADSHGYQDDGLRTMWPWRDWVIHAFNSNYSYEKFARWQLAGDMIPNANEESILATGFNRNHKITQEGGVIDEEYRIEYVTDRTNTFGKAFLSLTFECAHCHDHKYDPISQEEYYKTFAFFNQVPEKGIYGTIDASFADPPNMKISTKEVNGILNFINKKDTSDVMVMIMEDDKELRPTYILERGVYDNHGREVTFGLPKSVLDFDTTKYAPNRAGLADWLLSDENPITSRVYVNRIWGQFFGRGIVKSIGDFGMQGNLPSHPELLDWLAVDFQENGWDVKRLIKKMVLSSTDKPSSVLPDKHLAIAPENVYLARASRLRFMAENIRDHVLASSGLLNTEVGGPSIKPYQPKGLWEVASSGRGSLMRYIQDKGQDIYRRGMYVFIKRTVPPPTMLIFDASNRDQCEVQRGSTNTPLQALVMMNDPHVMEASRVIAEKLSNKATDNKVNLTEAFRKIICRQPTDKELKIIGQYYSAELDFFEQQPAKAEATLQIGEAPHAKIKNVPKAAAFMQTVQMMYNMEEAIVRN
ncbi:MAG: PSD1 and planctomycete cytochrome C domain-containing protein [Spirosomataceae bacterium]